MVVFFGFYVFWVILFWEVVRFVRLIIQQVFLLFVGFCKGVVLLCLVLGEVLKFRFFVIYQYLEGDKGVGGNYRDEFRCRYGSVWSVLFIYKFLLIVGFFQSWNVYYQLRLFLIFWYLFQIIGLCQKLKVEFFFLILIWDIGGYFIESIFCLIVV